MHGLALHLSYQSEALVPDVLQTSNGILRRSRLTVEERNEEDERSAQRQQRNRKTMTGRAEFQMDVHRVELNDD